MEDFTENEETPRRSWDDIFGDAELCAFQKLAEYLGIDNETANRAVMLVHSSSDPIDTTKDTWGMMATTYGEAMVAVCRQTEEVKRLRFTLAIAGLSKRGEGKDIATRGEFVKWYMDSKAGGRDQAERLFEAFCIDHNKRHKKQPQEQIKVAESGHHKLSRNQMISLKSWLPTQIMVKRDKKHKPPNVQAAIKEAEEITERATIRTAPWSKSSTMLPIKITPTGEIIGFPDQPTRKICKFPENGEFACEVEAGETPER